MRHSCAVGLLQSGADVTVIRDYLGHASIAATGRYITTNLQMKRDALQTCWKHSGIAPARSKAYLFAGAARGGQVAAILPGITSPLARCEPQDLDWVIVGENSDGEYAGIGGRAHQGQPIEVATDVSMMTRAGMLRIQRFAFKLAQSRPCKHLTVITKSGAQRHAMVMWDEIALEVSREFPGVTRDKELVDAATARMVNRPAPLDTIVATNLHADIPPDLAAALAGSLGLAPTANIDPGRRYPSMFEPIHGSAFDIMGRGLANPIGTFWSCVMMLEHLGEAGAAATLMDAIEAVTANHALHTRDLGGTAMTVEVTRAVCERVAKWGRKGTAA
jgi:tartrate dehydrogenase/decarboxylase/D-malate dehydrogenase